ncbi:DUF6787 family protein [Flexibacter flexilis]|uniref:DUF6787 family protein n=1 Tax=Flexibacter flexilis TaxID=998 RepID=UPI000AD75CC2|nr:DUF6787 family protein [Flexibacter flexilis]
MAQKPTFSILQTLRQRWGVSSVGQVLVILLVFACTGFSVMYLKRWAFAQLAFNENTFWLWRVIAFFAVLMAYQIILLAYGTLFGQFQFFWNFEKRMVRRIASWFGIKK